MDKKMALSVFERIIAEKDNYHRADFPVESIKGGCLNLVKFYKNYLKWNIFAHKLRGQLDALETLINSTSDKKILLQVFDKFIELSHQQKKIIEKWA